MTFKKFMTSRGSILALVVALLYGLLIFTIYYTGYQAMPKHLNELPVTVVNQDRKSQQLKHQIKDALPFKTVKTTNSLTQAKWNLNHRRSYLVVAIPANFSQRVQKNQFTKLDFYVNESNQTSVVSGMKLISQKVGDRVSQQVILKKGQAMLAKGQLTQLDRQLKKQTAALQSQLATKKRAIAAAPQTAQPALQAELKQAATRGQEKITQAGKRGQRQIAAKVATAYEPVKKSVQVTLHRTNPVKQGLNNSMAPFIANLAIYLGSLIGALLLYGTYVKFAKQVGKYRSFGLTEVAMGLIAIIGAGIISWTIVAMMGLSMAKLPMLWLIHGLELFAAYNFNVILILALGQIGTALNIFLTMIQVVAGAGMVPVATMNGFFKAAHTVSPMYYGITADFNTMFGGPAISSLLISLAILTVGTLVINLAIVALRKRQPMLQFEQLS